MEHFLSGPYISTCYPYGDFSNSHSPFIIAHIVTSATRAPQWGRCSSPDIATSLLSLRKLHASFHSISIAHGNCIHPSTLGLAWVFPRMPRSLLNYLTRLHQARLPSIKRQLQLSFQNYNVVQTLSAVHLPSFASRIWPNV
jgi:hypothetical protein